MNRYRFTTRPTGAKSGPWRQSRLEALQDALAADCAEEDRSAPHGITLDLMVEIEQDGSNGQLSEE